jgi:hypothetical protein
MPEPVVSTLIAGAGTTCTKIYSKYGENWQAHHCQWLGLAWIAGVTVFVLLVVTKALETEFWLKRELKFLPDGLQERLRTYFPVRYQDFAKGMAD